ncbi:type II toxin-antitoxin system VapC family toxin [Myxococcota bacterium]|nr:type II toxin-antitoxin system VapC family toxin [Myxococcota bacterium]
MRSVVIDSSALIRLYLPDGPLPEGLEDVVDSASRGDALLLVPELALAEAAQVLRKKELAGLLSAPEADEVLEAILGLPLHVVGHRELLLLALTLSRTHRATVYDALFLALSVDRGAGLMTADQEMARLAAT